jgi:transposase-like protein
MPGSHPPYAPEYRRRNWEQVTPLFAFAPELRKILHTTNVIESLSSPWRKSRFRCRQRMTAKTSNSNGATTELSTSRRL